MPPIITRCSPSRFARTVLTLTLEQRASASEICFVSLLHLKPTKKDHDFVSLLLHSFNPYVRRLKVDRRHIFISEADVQEIFGL